MFAAAFAVALLLVEPAEATSAGGRGKVEAQTLLDEGADFYERGDYAAALGRFKAAYEKYPSPKLWFNIGQANRDLGRPVEAVQAFERFLTDAPDAPTDALAEARASVADLKATLGRMQITCAMDGAEISVDGKPMGAAPVRRLIWATPGRHQIAVRHPGFVPTVEDVHVTVGEVRAIAVELRPLGAGSPQASLLRSPRDADADADADTDGVRDAPTPVYRRTWFWVTVGALVAATGAAVAVWTLRDPEIPSTTLGADVLMLRRLLLLSALLALACRQEPTVVVVHVDMEDETERASIVQLRAGLMNDGASAVELFPSQSAGPLAWPASFVLALTSARRGQLDLEIEGLATGGRVVARGCGSATIVAGGHVDTAVMLLTPPALVACSGTHFDAAARDIGVDADAGAGSPDARDGGDGATTTTDGADGAADAQPEAPPIPPEVLSWEPIPAKAGAYVTGVGFARLFMAAGFSDGEVFYASADRNPPTWSRIDQVPIQLGGSGPPWAVTAIAVGDSFEPAVWAGYASGGINVPSLYRSQLGASPGWKFSATGPFDDALSISKIPYGAPGFDHLIVVTARSTYSTLNSAQTWESYPTIPGFSGFVTAMAQMVLTGSVTRTWLGSDGLYFSDGDPAGVPDAGTPAWTRRTTALPQQLISAISVDPQRPADLWISLSGVGADSVWYSDDRGATWNNRHTPQLPSQPRADFTPAFGAVMPYPVSTFALINVRAPAGAVTTYYTLDQGRSWWPRGNVAH